MRRAELINGARELEDALTETRMFELLNSKSDDKKRSATEVLEALKEYSIRAHRFSPPAKQLSNIFNLKTLETPGRWISLLDRSPTSMRTRDQVAFALTFLPSIVEMLEPEILAQINRSSGEESPFRNMRVLSVSIYESDKVLSTPTRLCNVLESMNNFYTACALMENESPSTLSVIACDSGSDKSFDFLGIAKLMECVERLIGTIWDRAFFFREKQFEERLDLVAKSLPIMERIDTMLTQKQIDPEMAGVLKRNIFDGTNRFLQSGASIQKIEDTTEYNPRLLLSPVQKLLVAAPEDAVQEGDVRVEGDRDAEKQSGLPNSLRLDLSNLNSDEKALLLKLAQKSRLPTEDDPASVSSEEDTDEAH